ncbi:MAG: AI-2E family transporter [Woeseiaceae bacterium]|nr:AI-2E family transporter [Woeseiaceae bacterium]
MSSADSSKVDPKFLANSMASFLQIAAVVLLIWICYRIVNPFLTIIVWGVIISVSLYPAHQSLTQRLGGREKLAATLITLLGIAIIVIPAWLLADSTIGALKHIAEQAKSGTLRVPPPGENVAGWPVIGEQVHEIWTQAANNLEATLNQYEDQIKAMGQRAAGLAVATVGTVFQFIFSLIIAGALFMVASGGYQVSRNFSASLVGTERGAALTDMTVGTVRSVFKGVLGVAAIQAFASAVGMLFAGIPAAGLWAGAVLVLAIVQLPPILILGPIAFWYFSVADTVPAVIFLVFAIIVSGSDAFLKPMFLGRGLDTPMLVILVGAIGGAVAMGIVGLFIGAVVLALGYEILVAWMAPDEHDEEPTPATE